MGGNGGLQGAADGGLTLSSSRAVTMSGFPIAGYQLWMRGSGDRFITIVLLYMSPALCIINESMECDKVTQVFFPDKHLLSTLSD